MSRPLYASPWLLDQKLNYRLLHLRLLLKAFSRLISEAYSFFAVRCSIWRMMCRPSSAAMLQQEL